MAPSTPARLAAYTRVSTAAQAASGIGLEAQREAITVASSLQGFEIAGWFEDAGKSGASMKRRSGLQAALAEVAGNRVDGIVVAKIDRLGRSSVDVLTLVERARHEGWRLLALDCGLDTTTPAGELVAAALAMASRFEWRRISERQREKHDALRRAGRPRGRASVAPAVVGRIEAMRARGDSYRAIADQLNQDRVPTAQGGLKWYAASVRSALQTREREAAARHDGHSHAGITLSTYSHTLLRDPPKTA